MHISSLVSFQANLPLLQRELFHCARLARQTPTQYLHLNDHLLFDPARTAPNHLQSDVNAPVVNGNGKRVRSPVR